MKLTAQVEGIFAGGTGTLQPEGQRSGIFKRRLTGPARVEIHGIAGDEHADTRVHGGPEKAVHQYAPENYVRLALAYPQSTHELKPGSLGENICAADMTERNIHIGDVFQMGSAVLQVSQPRSPCWKINHRFGVEQMSMFVAHERITGWYYRVLQPGLIQEGDTIELLQRHTDRFSIDKFWEVQLSHRPLIDELQALAATPGLAGDWQRRLVERAKWLSKRLHD
ncbi:MOSC domain-containing protein [Pseudomonas gingeri]|uniref:MOSC domain-containing protein n=1 Tax=Pseudomonas gingeri TaxID=117681 RepID=A0A7Y7Y9W8_9PSED|nr:MOSC domain-containing protein [Pseudomonas gingeri]NWB26934.1 MOSC domain-containing protein [Pseudomonas gingeri]NWC32516.1 MOSC domain-containing protein [Pseudomonas gingeri]NWD05188.1 MOSC domain-containing protein [Pseudomonas gingeri]NWD49178.1 MOSC domain-containing protein [Pseudomonas gingeri]NWE36400.1 MOSC domain-containing protein [Pseudomonas gingeri]